MSENWTEKHRPESLSEVAGNNKDVWELREWIEEWSQGDKPQLLVGKPGMGKTTVAMLLSDLSGYPLIEVNTSSDRKAEDIERISGIMRTNSTDAEYQLVLLDECDSWHHATNKKPLYEELREPKNPIVLTANDEYETPNAITNVAEIRNFSLRKSSRRNRISAVAKREDMDLSDDVLESLAERPDLRSAINDLQNVSEGLAMDDDNRDWSPGEFDAVGSFLSGEKEEWRYAMGVRGDTFDSPEDAIMWLDENCKQQYRGLEAGVAFEAMSLADLSLGRAGESQDYSYWKYASAILEMLPETRLSDPYGARPRFPEWFRMSSERYDDGSPESALYQELKGDREYRFAGSYYRFRQRILPILRDLSKEERCELALNSGLSDDAIEALDLSVDDFEDWRDIESPEEGDGVSVETTPVSEMDW